MNVLGVPMVVRLHGRDTGEVISKVESHDLPGGGPPPHCYHREDETFQIFEGEYEWTVGEKKYITEKRATIFAPRRDTAYLPLPQPDTRPAHVCHHAGGLRRVPRGNRRVESATAVGYSRRD